MREPGRSPRARRLALPVWAVLTILGGLAPAQDAPAPPSASGETPATAEELLRLQDQLRRRTESALADRKQQQSRLDELDAEARAARRQNDAISRQIEKQEERLAAIRAETQGSEQRSAEIAAREERMKEKFRAFLAELEARITRGIPWKLADRRQAVADALVALDDARTGAAAALGTLSRLHKEQEALGRLVESGTLEVETPQGAVAVQGFHLGLLGVVFASEDGTIVGFAAAGETLEQGLEAVRATEGAADGYQRAVDILNRRRTPGLTDTYLPKLPIEEGKR